MVISKELVKAKKNNLLDLVFASLDGEKVNPNDIYKLAHEIYMDELTMLDELETYRKRERRGIEVISCVRI